MRLNAVGLVGVLGMEGAASRDADLAFRRGVWLVVCSWSWTAPSEGGLDVKIDLSDRGSLSLSLSMVLCDIYFLLVAKEEMKLWEQDDKCPSIYLTRKLFVEAMRNREYIWKKKLSQAFLIGLCAAKKGNHKRNGYNPSESDSQRGLWKRWSRCFLNSSDAVFLSLDA
jgi:hypothetical protein